MNSHDFILYSSPTHTHAYTEMGDKIEMAKLASNEEDIVLGVPVSPPSFWSQFCTKRPVRTILEVYNDYMQTGREMEAVLFLLGVQTNTRVTRVHTCATDSYATELVNEISGIGFRNVTNRLVVFKPLVARGLPLENDFGIETLLLRAFVRYPDKTMTSVYMDIDETSARALVAQVGHLKMEMRFEDQCVFTRE